MPKPKMSSRSASGGPMHKMGGHMMPDKDMPKGMPPKKMPMAPKKKGK